ncbi:ribonuclease II [Spirochaetia bacterium]|nr:ribonuclease II [Spirochaetia bacterium]
MIAENALVAYKNRPALVKEKAADKILIAILGGEQLKVREKDIEPVHPGPVRDFSGIEVTGDMENSGAVREAWELLAGQGQVSLQELAELAFGEYSPAAAWAAFRLLLDGLYFTGTPNAISPRQREDVEAGEKKREEKQRETGERDRFLERLRSRRLDLPHDGGDDARFMQDVEALAYGKSPKSRTMKDMGLSETPEDAHALLLDAGFWTVQINPHPARFGLSTVSAKHNPGPLPEEERRDLTHMAAFAIDSPWSNDPDDAVSIETGAGKTVLYVHVADPAAVIAADSPAEREARDRGATLYLPEGSSRMLADEALPLFALGLSEKSPALTFKITLGEDGEIDDTEIFPSVVKVRRLTYEAADTLMDGAGNGDDGAGNGDDSAGNVSVANDSAVLRDLNALAERNCRRRTNAGAVNIDLPETHISIEDGTVRITPIVPYRSAGLVRECMLLAGEGAGIWAAGRRGQQAGTILPFPYVGQETGDIPNDVLPGMAGFYQLRRCMRPRALSTKPSRHWGLGMDTYTQVTSPLRRYTDLLAHLQIRALLRQEAGLLRQEAGLPGGREPLSTDEVSARLGAGEAAAAAVVQAERASRTHWIMVYLTDKKDSVWDAVALEKKGNRWALMIPALALETQVPLRKDIAPNDEVKLVLKSVNIPRGEAVFVAQE